jgi:hypothetical protein
MMTAEKATLTGLVAIFAVETWRHWGKYKSGDTVSYDGSEPEQVTREYVVTSTGVLIALIALCAWCWLFE